MIAYLRRLMRHTLLALHDVYLDDMFTHNPEESTGEVAWEPMPEYGETEADRLYIRRRDDAS